MLLLISPPFYRKVWGCTHSGVRYLTTYNTNIPIIRKKQPHYNMENTENSAKGWNPRITLEDRHNVSSSMTTNGRKKNNLWSFRTRGSQELPQRCTGEGKPTRVSPAGQHGFAVSCLHESKPWLLVAHVQPWQHHLQHRRYKGKHVKEVHELNLRYL